MPFDTSCFPRTFQWVLVAGAAVALLGVATNRARAQKSPDKASLVPPVSLESLSPQGRWLEFKAGQKRRVHLWHEAGSGTFAARVESTRPRSMGASALIKVRSASLAAKATMSSGGKPASSLIPRGPITYS